MRERDKHLFLYMKITLDKHAGWATKTVQFYRLVFLMEINIFFLFLEKC